MAQLSLYFKTELEDKVVLKPNQLNGNLEENILKNLKRKVEKIAIANGIVIKVEKIIKYDYGTIDKQDFRAEVSYNVSYDCLFCSPVENLEIICVVNNLPKGYIIAKNGPVCVGILHSQIDQQKFKIINDTITIIGKNRPLAKGDYLRVSIINRNINPGEQNIITVCKLLDIATDAEIKSYKKDQQALNEDDEESKNDDTFI